MTTTASGAELRPAFVTAEECRQWLATTPLGNPVQALAHFLRQLNLLNRHGIAAGERLAILEQLRKPILAAQENGARRFIGRPLPLAPPEQAAFDSAQAVWRGLQTGYTRCLEASSATDAVPKAHLALLCQRALGALAAAQFDVYRAGLEPTPEHWHAVHDLYAAAERAGATEETVEDALRQGKAPSSPRAVYVEIMLLHAASPHELPARHLAWVARWARRWSARVPVLASPPPEGPARPLGVDLAGSKPADHRPVEGRELRWLDTASARQSLKKRLTLLDSGTSPAELQLGSDCVQPACGKVLRQVYQHWCKGGVSRRQERRIAQGGCELVSGVEAIHYYLSGRRPFRQPGYADDDALRRERDELAIFGRIAVHRADDFSQLHGFQVEEWQVVEEWQLVDDSATGIHATRPVNHAFARVSQGQLVAVRPAMTDALLLGCLRWNMITGDSRLHAGILIIPGRPEPVALRATDVTSAKEPYRPGFLLPAIGALGSPNSVIMPPGYFRGGRVLEVAAGNIGRIRLMQLQDGGVDFDRASYEPVT
jgi:cyclic-di-GMP-binding protein